MFDVNPVMISKWKAEFLENLSATFERSESTEVQYTRALWTQHLAKEKISVSMYGKAVL